MSRAGRLLESARMRGRARYGSVRIGREGRYPPGHPPLRTARGAAADPGTLRSAQHRGLPPVTAWPGDPVPARLGAAPGAPSLGPAVRGCKCGAPAASPGRGGSRSSFPARWVPRCRILLFPRILPRSAGAEEPRAAGSTISHRHSLRRLEQGCWETSGLPSAALVRAPAARCPAGWGCCAPALAGQRWGSWDPPGWDPLPGWASRAVGQ